MYEIVLILIKINKSILFLNRLTVWTFDKLKKPLT